MTKWERRVDAGLGYLGLFLIGSISWLADHIGRAPDTTTGDRLRSPRRITATGKSEPARTSPGAHPGQRAA